MKIQRHVGLMTVMAAVLVLFLAGNGEGGQEAFNKAYPEDVTYPKQ